MVESVIGFGIKLYLSIAGRLLRTLRAPKAAESTEKGLKKTIGFVHTAREAPKKFSTMLEPLRSKPPKIKREPPPIPP